MRSMLPPTISLAVIVMLVLFLALLSGISVGHAESNPCLEGQDPDCSPAGERTTTDLSDATDLPEVSARPPWTLLSRNDEAGADYVIERRKVAGSDFSTFRLEATLDSPPDLVARVAVRNVSDPDYHQDNTDKTILRDDSEALIVYSYIHINTPFVSDRDVISKIDRSYDAETQVHQLRWEAIEEGPPKKDGVIRLERSEGSWTFSPEAGGKTRAVYESYTETVGYLPAWIVNSAMSKTMLEGLESLRTAVREEAQGE